MTTIIKQPRSSPVSERIGLEQAVNEIQKAAYRSSSLIVEELTAGRPISTQHATYSLAGDNR